MIIYMVLVMTGGMPQMVFEYILKKHGIDPKTDLTIDQSISFGLTAAAFTSGDADYTVEFEPFATTLEMENCGTVVASLGRDSGYVPYTAYCAKKSYMEKNPQLIQKFTNAIQVIFHCDRNLAIHDLEQLLKQGKLSFASEKRMEKYLGLKPGSVSPFGLVNDTEHHVYVFLDENLKQARKLSFHPNDNRASLAIKTEDFIRYMDQTGNGYEWIRLY